MEKLPTPKEKALELTTKFYKIGYSSLNEYKTILVPVGIARKCALIAVDEILQTLNPYSIDGYDVQYWEEVKAELNKTL